MGMRGRPWAALAAVTVTAAAAAPAGADERKFTYSYEARTLPAGAHEFEQWATLRSRKEGGVYRSWDFREEVEYGLLDRLTVAVYLNWEYEAYRHVPGLGSEHEVEFETVSNEWKWKLTDPSADLLGSLLYAEWAIGEEYEAELKGVLSKDLGDFTAAYNFVLEWEREEEEDALGRKERESEWTISHTAGLSWAPAPGFALGVEALSRTMFEHSLAHSEHTAYFWGPNVHVASGSWWATLTFLKQVDLQEHRGLELEDHEKYEVRLIVGVSF